MIERYITTEQGTIYYWQSENWQADRDTIFFFPGLTADHTMFNDQIKYFNAKYNLLVWDAPCHGKSRPYKEFSFENTSKVIKQILDENGVDQMSAVGQSLGGYYAQAFMLRYPKRVKAFIGIGTTPYGLKYYSKSDKFWLRQVEWMSMCYPFKSLKKAVAKSATTTVKGYQNMIEMTALYGKREFCHLMQIAYDAFLLDNKDIEIKCPLLITYGERDKVGKVRQYCKMWHKKTGAPLVVIKGAGHNANVDEPEQMNQVMEQFLETKSFAHNL